jgi:hypothetical protein
MKKAGDCIPQTVAPVEVLQLTIRDAGGKLLMAPYGPVVKIFGDPDDVGRRVAIAQVEKCNAVRVFSVLDWLQSDNPDGIEM